MTDQTKSSPLCRTVCWLIAIALGGFLAVTLVNDFGQDQLQSGVIGAVTILLSGFVLRRVLCRNRGGRVAQRVAEAAALQAAAAEKPTPAINPAPAATAKAAKTQADTPKPAPHPVSAEKPKGPAAAAIKSEVTGKSKPTPQPQASEVDAKLQAKVLEEAQKVAKPVADEPKPAAPLSLETPLRDAPKETPAVADAPKASEPEKKPDQTAAPAAIAPRAPKGLEKPNDGQPDDLQKIEGIGAREETALHAAGIFHYQQLVTMNKRELAWLDENIAANDGVAQSGNWRKQAIALSRKAG